MSELDRFSRDLTAMILEERVEDLISVLDYEVTVDLVKEMRPAAVAHDLRSKGELYCRLFDTACARRAYGSMFLSVKDVIVGRKGARPVIRFFKDLEEDLGFAYIEYVSQQDSTRFGWKTAVMVEMEKVGGRWRIRALFPLEY